MVARLRVLFLCTHNSARSQMAEGWLRHLAGDRYEVHSAGVELTDVQPLAIRAMAEVCIDISGHQSKTLDRYLNQAWDYVITACDNANASCPAFSGGRRRLHWSLPDPSKATGSEGEKLAVYRQVRDAVGGRIEAFVESSS
jgi:arsenate reductase (thioredoxin)